MCRRPGLCRPACSRRFQQKNAVIGFDVNEKRISRLKQGIDDTHEIEGNEVRNENITYTSNLKDIASANFYIVAVPTPVDDAKRPDLSYLISVSKMMGGILKKGDIVVYESTVYPGATEEVCLPLLESESGLFCDKDFGLGYSPERINPGDKNHTFTKIKKIVSARDEKTRKILEEVYSSVVIPGVHSAPSIKVAEAAKIIENIQRDLNVSLMNELAIIFEKMDIDTLSVLEAASTKWNFINFSPGLVGGHCIGVDPYYLTFQAEKLGHIPQVILSGRRVNDDIGKFIAGKSIKQMIQAGHDISKARVTIFGITFKENCPDIRNTRVVDVIRELQSYGVEIQVHDDWANPEDVYEEYGIRLIHQKELRPANALIFTVKHEAYSNFALQDYRSFSVPNAVIIDVKGLCPRTLLEQNQFRVWRL